MCARCTPKQEKYESFGQKQNKTRYLYKIIIIGCGAMMKQYSSSIIKAKNFFLLFLRQSLLVPLLYAHEQST